MKKKKRTIAVLIDADNTQLCKLKSTLDSISEYGEITLKRAYGNWSKSALKNWKNTLNNCAIKAEQQFDYVPRKNATDMALVIDAMKLLYGQNNYDAYAIVSSDCDFTPLAIVFRESGKFVIGAGEAKTPEPFRNSCNVFLHLKDDGDDFFEPETDDIAEDDVFEPEREDGNMISENANRNNANPVLIDWEPAQIDQYAPNETASKDGKKKKKKKKAPEESEASHIASDVQVRTASSEPVSANTITGSQSAETTKSGTEKNPVKSSARNSATIERRLASIERMAELSQRTIDTIMKLAHSLDGTDQNSDPEDAAIEMEELD